MKISYTPKGVCSRQINIEVEDGIVQNVEYIGGCNGNLKGIGSLVKGMKVEDAVLLANLTAAAIVGTSGPVMDLEEFQKISEEWENE